jgi:hypothetical protein
LLHYSNGTANIGSRFIPMTQEADRYEVFFTLDSVASSTPRDTFRWCWVRIGGDGLVTVRGGRYPTLRAAIDGAADYRREHGGGEIRVNIQENPHDEADGAVHLD